MNHSYKIDHFVNGKVLSYYLKISDGATIMLFQINYCAFPGKEILFKYDSNTCKYWVITMITEILIFG